MTATTICFMMGSLLSQHYPSFKVLLRESSMGEENVGHD